MSLSSLFFVVCFLPVYLLVYAFVPGIARKNGVLLIFSLLFYAMCGLEYLGLVIAETAVAYFIGLRLGREELSDGSRKRWLVISLVIFIGILVFFKYTNFLLGSFAGLFRLQWKDLNIILPVGISFYTFKLISYVADVYSGKILPERNFSILLLYVIVFHNILQGPIVRFADIREEMFRRRMTRTTMAKGLERFCIGLAMKCILADQCGAVADSLIPTSSSIANVSTAGAWIGSFFFSLQMYLDFAAYSHMAIALGEMIGFHYKENFNYPYIAGSVRDFWRRWHISLSQFFRDYVYIPLGGSRVKTSRRNLNVFIVWILTGFWHGADWNFVLWGLLYFAFITLENTWNDYRKRWKATRNIPDEEEPAGVGPAVLRLLGKAGGHAYTILVFNFGWLIFRFTNFSQLGHVLAAFFGFGKAGAYNATVGLVMQNNLFFFIFCILASTPLFAWIRDSIENTLTVRHASKGVWYACQVIVTVALFVLALFALAGSTYRPFLYNQF